jgi:23S rRNA (cytidine2498-2'-O)-methyltransferase
MTSELLARGQQVTAIDHARLNKRLDGRPGLKFVLADVAEFQPRERKVNDALLCDMNAPPGESIAQVMRLSRYLKPHGLVVFTLKVPRVETVDLPSDLFEQIVQTTATAGLRLFAQTHLSYNRHEFTLFLEQERG